MPDRNKQIERVYKMSNFILHVSSIKCERICEEEWAIKIYIAIYITFKSMEGF